MSNALRSLHATLRQAGVTEDDTKRALYARVTGKISAKDMSDVERLAVVAELKRLYPALNTSSNRRRSGQLKFTGKYAKKLQALWIAAWNLGLIRNRDDAALIKFAERQTGISHVRFLKQPEDAAKVIEALKGWMAREAGVEWQRTKDDKRHEVARHDGLWIAEAQLKVLGIQTAEAARSEFQEISGKPWHQMTSSADWIPVMNALGQRIRAAKTQANSEAA